MGLNGTYIWPSHKFKEYDSSMVGKWLGRPPTTEAHIELEDSRESLALGRKSWQLINDTCAKNYSQTFNLTFNTCKDKEFVCMDGSCLNYDKRCDSIPDCPDGSDEQAIFNNQVDCRLCEHSMQWIINMSYWHCNTLNTKFNPCILLLQELPVATKHKANACVVLKIQGSGFKQKNVGDDDMIC
jgi:Low-density lipoprotein receptor domain class A